MNTQSTQFPSYFLPIFFIRRRLKRIGGDEGDGGSRDNDGDGGDDDGGAEEEDGGKRLNATINKQHFPRITRK